MVDRQHFSGVTAAACLVQIIDAVLSASPSIT